jgi:hypothetical protein
MNDENEKLKALNRMYLPRNIKLRVKERVVVIMPPTSYSETKEILFPVGVEVTLLNSDGLIYVATKTQGIKMGLFVRVYKGPKDSNEFDENLIGKEIVIPGDVLEIHPDEL